MIRTCVTRLAIGILVHLALALPLELIRTLSSQLFLIFCQGVFKLLAFSLMSLSVTCLLLKVVGESTTIFTSATFAVSLSFAVSSSPLRGPLVRPSLLADLRVSCIAYVSRYFPSRVLMTLVSLSLSLARGRRHVCEFCC